MSLLQQNILHTVVNLFFSLIIILMFVRWILSWFRLSEGNPVMLFFVRTTDPFLLPLRKRIPPVKSFDMSWFFAWILLIIARDIFLQALPIGW
jgi:uncharacterized protein YggT (Ycf19 family)